VSQSFFILFRQYKDFDILAQTLENRKYSRIIAVLRIRDVYPGSRILIFIHPGSRIPDLGSRIPDPKKATKERGEKKLVVICCHKFHKIVNYFSFEVLKKKIWANFQRIIELFTKKIVKKLLKIWSWDPGVKKHPIPDPGSGSSVFLTPGSKIRKRCFPDSGSQSCPLFISGQLAAASVDWSRSSPAKKTPDAAAMAEIASISKVRFTSILCAIHTDINLTRRVKRLSYLLLSEQYRYIYCSVECSVGFVRQGSVLFALYSLLYPGKSSLTTE
jgi:hypothetical protein